jgi:nifR3 family TIM-barrel protein
VAFRVGVRRIGGLGLAFSDLTNPRGVLRRNLRTAQILATCPEDRPLGIQLYGSEPEIMAEAAARLEEEFSPAVIDLNLGCPARKVVRKGGGSALLADPPLAARIAGAMVRAVSVPVTAKLRLGVDAEHEAAPEVARRLLDRGVRALTVHGRTARQRYTGGVDLEGIARTVRAAEDVPVFANGNVTSLAGALEMLDSTGAAGVAIGRGAMRNPWIFSQILAEDAGRPFGPPTRAEVVAFMRDHFRRLLEVRGVLRACRQFRKWTSQYGPQLAMTRGQRTAMMRLASPEDFETLAGQLLEAGA